MCNRPVASLQNGSEVLPFCYSVGTVGFYPRGRGGGGKVAGAWSLSADVKAEWSYIFIPAHAFRTRTGPSLLFILTQWLQHLHDRNLITLKKELVRSSEKSKQNMLHRAKPQTTTIILTTPTVKTWKLMSYSNVHVGWYLYVVANSEFREWGWIFGCHFYSIKKLQ